MDVLGVQLRTKLVQLGLQLILFLHLTTYLWPEDTAISDILPYYDYIIVGCGTSGSILANRLTASGRYHVLCIEAGGDPPIESIYPGTFSYLPNTQYDWNFTTVYDGFTAKGHRKNILELTSGKMIGGDSSLGHHLYDRGDPHDYNTWADILKDSSWNYENLLPYLKMSENLQDKFILNSHTAKFHGTNGNMGVTRHHKHINRKYLHGFKEAGNILLRDANGDKTEGYYEPTFMIKDGIRQSMAYTYLSTIKHRRNFHLAKNTEAIEINFDGNIAIGVTAVKNNKIVKIKATREIIIAAGAIKTPQILMLSGIGISDLLEGYNITVKVDLPVGKNYQDHLSVMIVNKMNIISEKSVQKDPHDFPLPIIIGKVAVDKNKPYPQYQTLNYIIESDSDNLLSLCSISYSYKDKICQSLYNKTKGYETMLSKIVLLHPKSRGHIILQSKDYRDDPMIIPKFFSHDEDLEAMVNYIADFLRVSQTKGFKNLGMEVVYPKLEECEIYRGVFYLRCYALNMLGTSYHYTSSCSMGEVVDNRLKVFNIERLRLVDASVMPRIISGNTQAAVMAIAEKAADMILKDATPPMKF